MAVPFFPISFSLCQHCSVSNLRIPLQLIILRAHSRLQQEDEKFMETKNLNYIRTSFIANYIYNRRKCARRFYIFTCISILSNGLIIRPFSGNAFKTKQTVFWNVTLKNMTINVRLFDCYYIFIHVIYAVTHIDSRISFRRIFPETLPQLSPRVFPTKHN